MAEQPPIPRRIDYAVSPLALDWPSGAAPSKLFPAADLENRLANGALPGVVAAEPTDRARMLTAFALVHLEEEIRREALVKDWGAFLRFLELAAAESGQNLSHLPVPLPAAHPRQDHRPAVVLPMKTNG